MRAFSLVRIVNNHAKNAQSQMDGRSAGDARSRSATRRSSSMRTRVLAAVAVSALPSAAFAQTTPQVNTSDRSADIVVTARQRTEKLQDVPITISAFSGEQLKNTALTSTLDIGMVTPGLVVSTQAGYFQPHLRGVGTTAASSSTEGSVAVYVDGVYYGAQAGSTFVLADIERIEIDKGPQGTLFGRNATGGLIQIITKEPQQKFSGSVSATAGNYSTFGTDAYVTGGLSPDISASLSIYFQNQGKGYGRNLFNGQYVNQTQDLAARQKFLFTPSARDKIVLAVDYEQEHSSPVWTPAPGTTPFGGPAYTGPRQSADGYYQPRNFSRQGGISLRIDHDLDFATLTSITAYLRSKLYSAIDGTLITDPSNALNIEFNDNHKQFTQEFDLRSKRGSPVTWATGVYFYYAQAGYEPQTAYGGLLSPSYSFSEISNAKTYSEALFAQASYEILRNTTLTIGGRYSLVQEKFSELQYGTDTPGGPTTVYGSVSNVPLNYSKPTWRLSLDNKLSPDIMIYTSYNRGSKSGGFNDQVLPVRTYQPERLDALEVGVKAQTPDHRVTLDTTGFLYFYKNIQTVAFPSGSQLIYSAPSAKIYGVDVDAKFALTQDFVLSGGVEYLHARYDESFTTAQYSIPDAGGGTILSSFGAQGLDAIGYHIPNSPTWTFNITPNYLIGLGDKGSLNMTANWSYNSGFFYEPDNRLRQKAYSVVNLSAVWKDRTEKNSVRLWARNLTNDQYTVAEYAQGNGDYAQYAPPRTFGVTLGRNF